MNKFEEAKKEFSKYSNSFPLNELSGMRYFKGLAELKSKDTLIAIKSWNELLEDHPLGYYSWRAREELDKICKDISCKVSYPKQYSATDSEIYTWLGEKNDEKLKQNLSQLEFSLQIAKVLIDTKNPTLCDDWLDYSLSTRSKSKAQLYFASKSLADMGHLGLGYRYSRKLLGAIARAKMDSVPVNIAQIIYPAGWSDQVQLYSLKFNVPAPFVYSIMRQESAFDANAESYVGAKGLLQLMPKTGERVAQWLGDTLHSSQELFNPKLNIKLGVRYMKSLFDSWDGNIVLVASEYNAGPKAAKRWEKLFSKYDFDVAVESISYGETRHYVKKVQGNLKNFMNFNPNFKNPNSL